MFGEIIAERLHALLIAGWQVDTWYLMETDQVDAAFQALQQTDDLTGMRQAVVESAKADIFKRAAALMGEIVLFPQGNRLF